MRSSRPDRLTSAGGGGRGEYRSIYTSLLHDEEFAALPVLAKVVFFTLKLVLPATGIGRVNARVVAALVGCGTEDLEDALVALAPKWVRRSGSLFWIPNGLRFQPALSPRNPKHRAFVAGQVAVLPDSPLVNEFRSRYAEWGVELSAAAPVEINEGPARGPAMPFQGLSNGLASPFQGPSEHIDKDVDVDEHTTTGRATPRASRASPRRRAKKDVPADEEAGSAQRSTDGAASRGSWLAPYVVAWAEAYGGGKMPTEQNVAVLRRLEREHGAPEVLRRWKHMLADEQARFARAALLERGWGEYAQARPPAGAHRTRGPASENARSLYAVLKQHGVLSCPPGQGRPLVEELVARGVITEQDRFIAVYRRLDLDALRNARTAEWAERQIQERAGDLLSSPVVVPHTASGAPHGA